MNEELQQALSELIIMIKSGLSNLPPLLERMSHELVTLQVVNGCVGLGIELLFLTILSVILTKLYTTKHAICDADRFVLTTIFSAVLMFTILGIWYSAASIMQGLFAPTTVLVDYLLSLAK